MRGRPPGRPPPLFFTSRQGGLCARSPTGARPSCRGAHPGPNPEYWAGYSPYLVALVLIMAGGVSGVGAILPCVRGRSGGQPGAGIRYGNRADDTGGAEPSSRAMTSRRRKARPEAGPSHDRGGGRRAGLQGPPMT